MVVKLKNMTESQRKLEEGENASGDDSEEPEFQLSEKGKRMANSIAEFLLMRYFFPEFKKDRKK